MNQRRTLSGMLSYLLCISLLLVPTIALAAPPPTTHVVTNTDDYGASDPPVIGSLRWAMTQANSDGTASRITFDIDTTTDPGCVLGGPCTIQPERALPFLNSGETEIDGYSQPGALEAVGSGFASIKIEIDGFYVTGNNGFNITTANNSIRGLVINRFGLWGIAIYNPAADDNVIAGNYIGTDTSGLVCSMMGNGSSGVLIENGAEGNIIGGTNSADRNIISCNHLNGIDISDVTNSGTTSGNQVLGNIIGDPSLGVPNQGNNDAGVFIGHGAFDNTVGGPDPGAMNLINGNGEDGIQLYGPETTGNVIAGNLIGVNGDATVAMANLNAGVNIIGGAHDNTVGGTTDAERNIISGNMNSGVRIAGPATHGNDIVGNYIGTNIDGSYAIANNIAGVQIDDQSWGNTIGPVNLVSGNLGPGILIKGGATLNGVAANFIGTNALGGAALMNIFGVRIEGSATYNSIGGVTLTDANLISGNQFEGIYILDTGTIGNVVFSNTIGTNYGATAAVPNSTGVFITGGAQSNHVGQATSGNLIAGNFVNGVRIQGTGTNLNTVAGNTIGVDGTGSLALPNIIDGVTIALGAQENIIGGDTPDAGNLISGNSQHGVNLEGAATTNNIVSGNYIGVDPGGTSAIPNGEDGVHLRDGASGNTIGGDEALERNVISGNTHYGVYLEDSGTDDNQISGNYIGTNAAGNAALPNGSSGVSLQNGSAFNTIGGTGPDEGNVISGNSGQGIYLVQSGTENNTISANIIGLDASGLAAVPNNHDGIMIQLDANANIVGGSTPGERNIISGNLERGIRISDCSNNVIEENYIGTDISGIQPVGNGYDGVQISSGALNNTIGPENRIVHNGYYGVGITDLATTGNIVTQNQIHSNGMGGIRLIDGANGGISPAYIGTVSLNPLTITGTACPGCAAEVFANPVDEEEGWIYLGSAVANGGGNWSLPVSAIPAPFLTATATDATDGTSQFSYTVLSGVRSLFLPVISR